MNTASTAPSVLYMCMVQGSWYTEGLASGYARSAAGSFATLSVSDGLTAHAGGGQGSGTAIAAMTNLFSTVATAGDSATLPVSKPGMQITVINKTATSMNVFPATGETINALAANTALAVAGAVATIFWCGTAGSWWTK